MTEERLPAWWDEVIDVDIRTRTDAKRIVQLCREGELHETWEPQWSTFATRKGRIRLADFERAQDVLMGVADPDPGRQGFHDWKTINKLIDEATKDMGPRVIRAEVCRRVAEAHPISPVSSALRKRVTDRLKETGQ
jgi:hypothetical protein